MGEIVTSITAEPGLTWLTRPRSSGKQSWNIAVLQGDGVGPEVMTEGIRALKAVEKCLDGVQFELIETAAGPAEFLRSGEALPTPALETCRTADATLLCSMGHPNVRWPDGRELTPQLDIREKLDLYCGLRPVKLYHANDTPLKRFGAGEIDFVIVRENTKGLFSARQSKGNSSAAEVCDTLRITRRGAERLFRSAFQLARQRRRKVTLVDKANVLPSMVFFRSVFDRIAGEFPDVETERIYVDAAALYLLRCPDRFDVLVTENMFGDILSDLGASLVGGMGMAPAADLGDRHAVFQPAHGSAPDIAGKGIANPVAAILTVALMLDWLNTVETRKGAAMIRRAVETVLSNPGNRTPDCGGALSTREMGELIIANLGTPCPRIIDLTLTLRPGMRGVEITPKYTVARDGWNASTLQLYSHCGTHMDAQVHFEAGTGTIDRHPPQRCMGAAWVVNLTGIAPRGLIEVPCLGAVAEKFQPGESLLLRTDWSRHHENSKLYRDGLPRISEAFALWCVRKRIRLLGVEPPSVADVNNKPEVTLIHQILLGGGVTIVEGLINLDQLRNPQVFFVALPLKIEDGDGCPCRALAIEGIPTHGWLEGGVA